MMRYFQCPLCKRTFNATQAILDYSNVHCGARLQPYKPRKVAPIGSQCSVTGPTGQRCCSGKPVASTFCSRHKYLAHSS